MEVWKMIRTGNEKLDPNTLVLPVAAGAAIPPKDCQILY